MEASLNIASVPPDKRIINFSLSTRSCLETSGYVITGAIYFSDLLFIFSCKVYINIHCCLLSVPHMKGRKKPGLQVTLLEIGVVTSWNIGTNKTSKTVEKIVSLIAFKGF